MALKKNRIPQVKAAVERAVNKGLESATIVIHGRAVLLAPVKTGNLRSSLDRRVEGFIGSVGTNVHYAPHVEYGTYKMRAQPYLRPALFNSKTEIYRIFKNAVSEEVRRSL